MLAHFPSNCSLISTSLTRCVVSNGTTFTEQVCRCVPNMEAHSIRLYALGHTSKVLYRPACITSGVNTREVHEYNVLRVGRSPMNAPKKNVKPNLFAHL